MSDDLCKSETKKKPICWKGFQNFDVTVSKVSS